MYCTKCGREIKEGINFCPYCGNSINKNVENKESLELVLEENSPQTILHETKEFDNIAKILLILTIIVGILTVLPYNVIICYTSLALSLILFVATLILYIRKHSKYEFLLMVINGGLVLMSLALIFYSLFLQ